jgi:hypothetical protein
MVSERKITDIVSEITGIKFDIKEADVQKDADKYFEILKSGNDDQYKRFSLYMLMMYGTGFGGDYRDIAMNKTLGLRVMDDEEIERSITGWLKGTDN